MERTTCRACGSGDLVQVIDLGEQYVNDFLEPGHERDGLKIPIVLDLCQQCTLVQARHTPPPEELYKKYYWYRSGVTDTMRLALRDVVDSAQKRVTLYKGDIVLDVGSNDGTLLRQYPFNLTKIGVEPADNLQEEGRKGINLLIHDFWPTLRWPAAKKAKIITACGMFYDLDDPNPFIAAVADVLADDGVFVAQLMLLRDMIELNDVGNFSHEHLEFYSMRSLELLFAKHGLDIFDVERNKVNGGSTRLYVRKGRRICSWVDDQCLRDPLFYQRWQKRVDDNAKDLLDLVRSAVNRELRVWVYGASTKGNVILQHADLDHTLIEGAAERSPEKWGKVTIGSGIPIYSENYARERADYFLVLPYAFLDEFMLREKEWRGRGGRFIVPLPEVRIV